jgi:hypothetical protein
MARSKKERLTDEIAELVGAGKPWTLDSVDFSDPNRPKTCLGGRLSHRADQRDRADRGQRGQADLPDVEMVGAAALQRLSRHAARRSDQGPR